MSKPRASIFEEAPQLDMSSFAPKAVIDTKGPPVEQVRAVSGTPSSAAEKRQFRSLRSNSNAPRASTEPGATCNST